MVEIVPIDIELKHRGAVNELAAVAWLYRQGYEVFRNVSGWGHIDIVAVRNGKALFIDVKSAKRDMKGIQFRLSQRQQDDGVVVIYVDKSGTCTLDMHPSGPIPKRANCDMCGKEYQQRGPKRFCSKSCRNRYQIARREVVSA